MLDTLTLRLRQLCGAIFVTGSMLLPLSSVAFDSHEHIDMSNAAFLISRQIIRDEYPSGDRKDAIDRAFGQLLEQSSVRVDGQTIMAAHFGQITACVDFFLTPEKMLAMHWKESRPEQRPGNAVDGFPEPGPKLLIELETLCQRTGAGFMQATHNNHTHFQRDLLMALRVWHRLAISVANEEQNLFGGLFISAVAGHYLQDFFAPGHLATPRDAMTDVPATAMHDLANIQGAYFQPTPASPSLKRILGVIRQLAEAPGDKCESRSGTDALPVKCALTLAGFGANVETRVDVAHLMSDSPLPVFFLGDNRLMQPSQDQQRLLLLAVQVQSILDVVENKNSLNSFWFSLDGDGLPHAKANFGRYQFPNPTSAQAVVMEVPEKASAASTDKPYRPGTMASILSISDQRESQSSGAYSARSVYTLEWTPGGFIKDISDVSKNFLNRVEIRPSFGYAYYDQGRKSGHGPTLRVALTVPETELSIGPYLRWFTYSDEGNTVRKLNGGLRFEGGFSSYLTFYVIAGMDHSTAIDSKLKSGRIWGGGLRLSLPTTRIGALR